MSAPALEAKIEIEVGEGDNAFRVSAEVALQDGILVLFGPSGAGKSLVLQAVGGLVRPESGYIRVCGETVFDAEAGIHVPPHKRRLGYVPQHHSLFPFCDVMSNILFGLPRRERKRKDPRILTLLEELGISHLATSRPSSLSGGERQRVALARALAVRPRMLLLDEPFAAIDFDGRSDLRAVLRRTLAVHETPALFITHDPAEALDLGDRMLKFERGRTIGAGAPSEFLDDGLRPPPRDRKSTS
jgi:molybdate transport system ATP-binding protein